MSIYLRILSVLKSNLGGGKRHYRYLSGATMWGEKIIFMGKNLLNDCEIFASWRERRLKEREKRGKKGKKARGGRGGTKKTHCRGARPEHHRGDWKARP